MSWILISKSTLLAMSGIEFWSKITTNWEQRSKNFYFYLKGWIRFLGIIWQTILWKQIEKGQVLLWKVTVYGLVPTKFNCNLLSTFYWIYLNSVKDKDYTAFPDLQALMSGLLSVVKYLNSFPYSVFMHLKSQTTHELSIFYHITLCFAFWIQCLSESFYWETNIFPVLTPLFGRTS